MSLSFVKRLCSSRLPRSDRRPRRSGVSLHLEALEARWLPNATVITVTTAADDPTTPIAGQTTLRDAINQANQTTGDTIQFAQSLDGQSIQPTAALPAITGAGTTIEGGLVAHFFEFGGASTINASSAPYIGFGPITLDGSKIAPTGQPNTNPVDGLDVEASNVTIEGLNIVNWSGSGINVGTSVNGVSNANISGNTISNNGGNGVRLLDASQVSITNNTISSNGANGVEVDKGNQDTIQGNSIAGNGYLGIYMSANANNSLTAPVLTSAINVSTSPPYIHFLLASTNPIPGSVNLPNEPGDVVMFGNNTCTIQGFLNLPSGAPNGVYTLEFFASGGTTFLGTFNVTASGGTLTPFTATLHNNFYTGSGPITATVTDPSGDTSEFSNSIPITQTQTQTPTSPSPSSSPSPSTSPAPQSPAASTPTAPATPTPSSFQAAITLFIDGAEMLFDELAAYANPNLAAVNADIAANSPYAGPFADWLVLAGEMAMAEQLSATT